MAHHESHLVFICRWLDTIWNILIKYYIIIEKFSQDIKLSSERTNKHSSNRIYKFVQHLNNVNLFKHSYFSIVHFLSITIVHVTKSEIQTTAIFPLLCLGLVMSHMYNSLWSKGDFKAAFLKASGAPKARNQMRRMMIIHQVRIIKNIQFKTLIKAEFNPNNVSRLSGL